MLFFLQVYVFALIVDEEVTLLIIPGHAGGQGYDPPPPQPLDPIVITYKVYVVDLP